MKILVLGGTRFFGKVLVNNLIKNGHEVTIGTRGLTKDEFGHKVKRLVIDRTDKDSLENELKDKEFDVVYDNICYTSNEAKILLNIIKDKTKKYIVTSTMAVYDYNKNLKEEDFNPYNYVVKFGDKKDFTYGEGKRQVEALVFQQYDIPSIAVRFPVVLGKDDYTERLKFYVQKVMDGKPIKVSNLDFDFSFISSEEAGEFLMFLGEVGYEGPINGASNGTITIREILNYISDKTGKKAILSEDGEVSPYNWIEHCSMDISKGAELGFNFRNLDKYLYDLIDYYLDNK